MLTLTRHKNTATVSIKGVNSLNSFYTSPNSSSCSALRSSWEAGTEEHTRHSRRSWNRVTFVPPQSAPVRCFISVFIMPYYVWDLTQNTFRSQLPLPYGGIWDAVILLFFGQVSFFLSPSTVYLESICFRPAEWRMLPDRDRPALRIISPSVALPVSATPPPSGKKKKMK